MLEWIIWGVLLFLQNASHTATSRSRNSKSLSYTAIASVFSNGIWFASQFYIVSMMVKAKEESWVFFAWTLAFYIVLTAAGSTLSHWYLMRYEHRKGIEKG
jgi:hypothetical protein